MTTDVTADVRMWWGWYCDSAGKLKTRDQAVKYAKKLGFNTVAAEQYARIKAHELSQQIGPKTMDACDARMAELFLGDLRKTEHDFAWAKFCAESKNVDEIPRSQNEIAVLYDAWAKKILERSQYPAWVFRGFYTALERACFDHKAELKQLYAVAAMQSVGSVSVPMKNATNVARRIRQLVLRDVWRTKLAGQFIMTTYEWGLWEREFNSIPLLERTTKNTLPVLESSLARVLNTKFPLLGDLVQCSGKHVQEKAWCTPVDVVQIRNALSLLGLELGMPVGNPLVKAFNSRQREVLVKTDELITASEKLRQIYEGGGLQS